MSHIHSKSSVEVKGISGWSGNVFYDPDADNKDKNKTIHEISDSELCGKLTSLIDATDKIISISIYKIPLKQSQWTNWLLHHQYCVLETNDWYWSIEKNSEGLTIQRGSTLDSVLYRYRQQERLKDDGYWDVQLIRKDSSNKTMHEVVAWISGTGHLNRTYRPVLSNCQHFSKQLFNAIAETERKYPAIWNPFGL